MRARSSSACSPRLPSRWSSWGFRWKVCAPRSTWIKAWRCCAKRSKPQDGCDPHSPPFARMTVVDRSVQAIHSSEDVVRVRQLARERAVAQGFSLVDQTKLVTAASELARNTLEYGGGGEVSIEVLNDGA